MYPWVIKLSKGVSFNENVVLCRWGVLQKIIGFINWVDVNWPL